MIQRAFITEWRGRAPWALDEQVEQDLILSRALTELYADDLMHSTSRPSGPTAQSGSPRVEAVAGGHRGRGGPGAAPPDREATPAAVGHRGARRLVARR